MPEVIILGVTSDIVRGLANRCTSDGWSVTGTYRTSHEPSFLSANSRFVPCDLSSAESIDSDLEWMLSNINGWDALVVAFGSM